MAKLKVRTLYTSEWYVPSEQISPLAYINRFRRSKFSPFCIVSGEMSPCLHSQVFELQPLACTQHRRCRRDPVLAAPAVFTLLRSVSWQSACAVPRFAVTFRCSRATWPVPSRHRKCCAASRLDLEDCMNVCCPSPGAIAIVGVFANCLSISGRLSYRLLAKVPQHTHL